MSGVLQERPGATYSKVRVDWGVVDITGNVLNLRIILPRLRWRRSARLQRRHGGELFVGGTSGRSSSGSCCSGCGGERGTQSSGLEGGQSQVSGGCADTAIDGRHRCQLGGRRKRKDGEQDILEVVRLAIGLLRCCRVLPYECRYRSAQAAGQPSAVVPPARFRCHRRIPLDYCRLASVQYSWRRWEYVEFYARLLSQN